MVVSGGVLGQIYLERVSVDEKDDGESAEILAEI